MEQMMSGRENSWAVFPAAVCEDPGKAARANQEMVNAYVCQGNQPPKFRIFINEVPAHRKQLIKRS